MDIVAILVLDFDEARTWDETLLAPGESLKSFGMLEALNVADKILVHVKGPNVWHLGYIDAENAVFRNVEDLESKE